MTKKADETLQEQVDRIELALTTFFEELGSSYVSTTFHIEVAGGKALNILKGVEE